MHVKLFNPEYDEDASFLYGQSPLRALRRSLEINNRAIDTGRAYIENQGVRGILYNKETEESFSEEQMDQFRRNFKRKNGGVTNANDVGISNLELGWVDMMHSAADIALLEQYGATQQDLCNAYSFPSLLLKEDATYENRNEAKKQLWNDVVIPMLSELRDGLNCWLSPQFGENLYIDFDLTGVHAVQEDKLMRFKAIKEAAGMITVNEARTMAGLPAIDKLGDVSGEDMYVGFTQAVVQDTEEISPVNGESEEDAEAGA